MSQQQANTTTSLGQLLCAPRAPQQIVAFDAKGNVDWRQFVSDVAHSIARLENLSGQRWALLADDAYAFSVGLMALCHAGKTIVLPPNAQSGTLSDIAGHVDGFVTPLDALNGSLRDWIEPQQVLSPLHRGDETPADITPFDPNDCQLELFTSGSTGQAKSIHKRLSQFDDELIALQELWGPTVRQSACFSTVSQQHIYGLLFRICWPLAAGIPIWRHNILFPSTLQEAIQHQKERKKAFLVATPAHLQRIGQWVDATSLATHISAIFSSGGPLSEKAAHQWERDMGAPPFEILGSSETGGVAWRQQAQGAKTQWSPLPQVEIRCDEAGSLCVRSPYAPGPADAWFVMGDRIELGEDGRFQLLGRRDRIVKIAEKRLSLDAMEQKLEQSIDIASSAVLMVPAADPHQTDKVLGCLLTLTYEGRQRLDAQGQRGVVTMAKELLRQHFEQVLLPKRWRIVDEMPQDPQGKRTIQALLAIFAATEPAQIQKEANAPT